MAKKKKGGGGGVGGGGGGGGGIEDKKNGQQQRKVNGDGGGGEENTNDQQKNANGGEGECDGGGEEKNNDQQKNTKGEGGKNEDRPVILKIDLHCIGCISKCKKVLGGLDGLVSVKADMESNKLTIVGKVNPAKAKEILEQKTKKKVEIISPLPKKEKEGGGGGEKKEKKEDEKKTKEPQLITAVLKLSLHCEGCIQKIYKTITKTQGYHEIKFDREKELVTVKGTMDMKMLAESLKEKLKRNVEMVPPKKEGGGGVTKEKGGDGGGGKEKEKEKGNSGGGGGGGGGGKAEEQQQQVQFYPDNYGYGYGYPIPPVYGYPTRYTVQASQVGSGWGYQNPPGFAFSEENPNACSVM